MERLTYRDANGELWYSDNGTERDRLHRLAAYEDTGLAPEEIQIQKEAMERMGWFGKMFQRYKGDPRGPIGTLGTALGKSLALLIVESAKNRQPVKDVDGNTWLPMLLDEFESMADIIEHGQEWIPVEERLPEDDAPAGRKQITVMVTTKAGKVTIASRVFEPERDYCGKVYPARWLWSRWLNNHVTHWMPLPKPPKEEKK